MSNTKAFLRWAGSKQKLVPQLSEYWGNGYSRYLEPFMGSAKLFFSINTNEALLSDINKELVETFNQIKKSPLAVYNILKEYKVSKAEYYKVRSLNPNCLGANQRAARFIFLNKLCFNGLYRTNLKGDFNVPYSGQNKFDIESEYEAIKESSKKLKYAKIICGDFEQIIKQSVKSNDFVYLDPPYAVSNRRIFNQYGPQTFGINDLNRLSRLLSHIDKKGAFFLLSYAYCSEALEIFNTWNIKKKFTQRNIAGFSRHRRKAAELLISNI